MAIRIRNPAIQHFDKDTRAPLSGGQLFFFEPGTSTPKDTFADAEETATNTNPVVLDADGFEPDIFGVGSYRVELRATPVSPATVGILQWVRDPVDFSGADEGTSFSDWQSSINYSANDIVQGSDGNFYISIQDNNLNNDPTGSPAFWSQFDLINRWNPNENYVTGDAVRSLTSGIIYTAVANSTNEDPDADTARAFWMPPLVPITFNQEVFTANGVWNNTNDVRTIMVEMVGGGAGGGASNSSAGQAGNTGGAGGGSGAYVREILDVTGIVSGTVTIGTGGTGGDFNGSGVGGNGTATTFSLTTASAGGGFGGSSSGTVVPDPGNAGVASGGGPTALLVDGEPGNPGSRANTNILSGAGGSSYFGGAGKGQAFIDTGGSGTTFGGGGGGGTTDGAAPNERAGGAGADGVVIITEFMPI